MHDLPYLIDRWRFMRRAAADDAFAPYNHNYARMADAYALCIRRRIATWTT